MLSILAEGCRSMEETWALVQGVEECGGGKWADIKRRNFKPIEKRTAVSFSIFNPFFFDWVTPVAPGSLLSCPCFKLQAWLPSFEMDAVLNQLFPSSWMQVALKC